jgi:hypothetical protein
MKFDLLTLSPVSNFCPIFELFVVLDRSIISLNTHSFNHQSLFSPTKTCFAAFVILRFVVDLYLFDYWSRNNNFVTKASSKRPGPGKRQVHNWFGLLNG